MGTCLQVLGLHSQSKDLCSTHCLIENIKYEIIILQVCNLFLKSTHFAVFLKCSV